MMKHTVCSLRVQQAEISNEINAPSMDTVAEIARSLGCRCGHHAPQIGTLSARSPAPGKRKRGYDASQPIKLDGNLARRNFPASDREQVFRDEELPGFGLRVRKGGGVGTWFVNVHRRSKRIRLTLGRADAIGAEEARGAARAALAAAVLDGLPQPPKQLEAVTFAAFAVEFTKDYAHHWKPATRKTSADYLRRELLPVFGARGVAEIMRTDISRWRDSYAGTREGVFNRTVPILSVMLQYAEQLGYRRRGSNPCRGIARYKRQLPERYLSPVEYK
jgi:hypothetical protein